MDMTHEETQKILIAYKKIKKVQCIRLIRGYVQPRVSTIITRHRGESKSLSNDILKNTFLSRILFQILRSRCVPKKTTLSTLFQFSWTLDAFAWAEHPWFRWFFWFWFRFIYEISPT